MKLSSKHANIRTLSFVDLTGGVNFSVPPEALKDNEVQTIVNWEFDPASSILKTRDGTEKVAEASADIETLYYAKNLGLLLVVFDGKLYKLQVDNSFAEIGSLNGTKIPIFAEWEEKVLLASGAKLQETDGVSLSEITDSPQCDFVTTQHGRVVVSQEGDDYVYWSGVGDETNWNFAGGDQDALRLRVGYKDGGNIVSLRSLSKDLVVFKDNRRVYRIVGAYPDWLVLEISRDAGTVARLASLEVGNSVVFVDEIGIRSLDTVMEYGDIKVKDVGYKINTWIKDNLSPSTVRLWHVRPKGQVWFKSQDDKFVYVFHYNHRAWTIFSFPEPVGAVAYTDNNEVYLAFGNKLCRFNQNLTTDIETSIEARVVFSRKLPFREFLLKRGRLVYQGIKSGNATVEVGRLSKQISLIGSGDIAYYDYDIAYNDTDPVVAINRDEVSFTCNYRLPFLEPKLTVVSGGMRFLGLIFETAEV